MAPKKISIYFATSALILFSALTFSTYASNNNSNKFTGFGFNVNQRINAQGMMFGPFKKDKLYNLKCRINASNSKKNIKFTICFDGTLNTMDALPCPALTKNITTQVNADAVGTEFIYTNLKPLKLTGGINKKFKTKYGILFSVSSLLPVQGNSSIQGTCSVSLGQHS